MSSIPPGAASNASLPHDSRVHEVRGTALAMLVLVTFVVSIRLWTRLQLVRSPYGADDGFILVAWMLAFALDVILLMGTVAWLQAS